MLGIARSAAWLEDYKLAEQSYRGALSLAVSEEDRAVASAGLARMLNIADRPREAFALAYPRAAASLPNAIEAARAALTLGREGLAAAALEPQAAGQTPEIAQSRLGREYRRQQDEVAFRTRPHLIGGIEYSRDSDGVRAWDTALGAAFSAGPAVQGSVPRWTVAARHQTIDEKLARAEVSQVEGGVRATLGEDLDMAASLAAAHTGDWTYGAGKARLAYRPRDDAGMEIGTERDAVRTVTALNHRLTVRSLSLGGDVRLADTVLAGALGQQRFSDGNDRDGAVVRITFPAIVLIQGGPSLTPQLYARYFQDSEPGLPGYFSPRRIHEQRLNLRFGTRLSEAWAVGAVLGPGHQSVDGVGSNTLNAELKVSGRIGGDARAEFFASRGDTAAYASTGPGYRRSVMQLSLIIPW